MGWNAGFDILAEQAICLYNKNLLTKDIMECLMEPLRGNDVDTGNSDTYKANDGKDSMQVICSVIEPEEYILIEQKYNFPLENTKENEEALDNFHGDVYLLWHNTIALRFEFW